MAQQSWVPLPRVPDGELPVHPAAGECLFFLSSLQYLQSLQNYLHVLSFCFPVAAASEVKHKMIFPPALFPCLQFGGDGLEVSPGKEMVYKEQDFGGESTQTCLCN